MTMPLEETPRNDWPRQAAETAIRLGVLALVVIWCLRILEPFLMPMVWGVIIAVAIHPVYRALLNALKGRRALAATLISSMLLVLLVAPTIMLTELLVNNVSSVAASVQAEKIVIPPPPEQVKQWPLVGELIANAWTLASTNLPEALKLVQPQLKAVGGWLVNVAASAGIGLLMFLVAFAIAGVLLAHSEGSYKLVHALSRRLVGERGDDFADLAEATIRSVARGVLGVAFIQALLAGLGFMVAGVPGAGIWALLSLISAIVQIGVGPIVIPAIIYVFATGDTVTAVVFLIWNVFIMVLDNILKPLLLGRGVAVPMVVIFLGAVGGLLLSGIVGLFTGAVILALGYKLFQAWLAMEPGAEQVTVSK